MWKYVHNCLHNLECVRVFVLHICGNVCLCAFMCVCNTVLLYSMLCCVVYTICMFVLLRVNMYVCVRLCFVRTCVRVCLLNAAGFRSWWREREGWRQRIKTNEVQSSEADDCVFVGLNLFITDARKISIETILVTDSPCISPMAGA